MVNKTKSLPSWSLHPNEEIYSIMIDDISATEKKKKNWKFGVEPHNGNGFTGGFGHLEAT